MSLYIFLRIPPLFIIDKIFSISFGIYASHDVNTLQFNIFGSLNDILRQFEDDGRIPEYVLQLLLFYLFIRIIASCLIFCLSLCIVVLPNRYLYPVYIQVATICVVIFSSLANLQTLNVLSEHYVNLKIDMINKVLTWDVAVIISLFAQLKIFDFLCLLFSNIILQFCLSLVFNFLQVCTTNHSIYKVACISFMIPTFVTLIAGVNGFLNTITILLLSFLPLFVLPKTFWMNILTMLNLIPYGFNHTLEAIKNYELKDFIEMEWSRLKMPSVLRLFWAIRLLDLFILSLLTKEIKHETLFGTVKYLLVNGCDTYIAVMGMASFVSYFCIYIGAFFRWVLLTGNREQINIGKRSAILFFVLALHSGLTDLKPQECYIQLVQNFSLTCDLLMFYILGLVDSLLISLSVNRNKSINRHLRGLLVSGFLIVVPIIMLRYLWYYDFINDWLIESCAINFQIVVKVLVTLGVYSLHMIDGYYSIIWDKFDDYAFYIESFGDVATFCFSTSIFVNLVYTMVFESISVTCVFFIFIHVYNIIWPYIRNGWRVLVRRRLAIKRVESLADATSVQLSEFDDICSICRQNMDSAKITNCNHYFHSICLRKWLNLKDNCPLCHDILYQA